MQDKLRARIAAAFLVPLTLLGVKVSEAFSRQEIENMNEASNLVTQTDWMGIYTSTAVGGLVAGVDTGIVCAAVYWLMWRVNSKLVAS
jgi:tetrahydromethanopterin S-methyltransferase subunit D